MDASLPVIDEGIESVDDGLVVESSSRIGPLGAPLYARAMGALSSGGGASREEEEEGGSEDRDGDDETVDMGSTGRFCIAVGPRPESPFGLAPARLGAPRTPRHEWSFFRVRLKLYLRKRQQKMNYFKKCRMQTSALRNVSCTP